MPAACGAAATAITVLRWSTAITAAAATPARRGRRACGGGAYAIGANLATLPPNCSYRLIEGGTYYVCGNTWLDSQYGANGLYYQVVPPL